MENLYFIYGCVREYGKSMLHLLLYIGSLVYVSRQKDKVMMQVFLWPVCAALVTIFNPIIISPFFDIPKLDLQERYYRFAWILPITILSAYMLAVLWQKQPDIWKKVVLGVLILLLISCGGNSATLFRPDENIYKIPDEVIEISNVIDQQKAQENVYVLCDGDIFYRIRQYNPTLILVGDEGYLRSVSGMDEAVLETLADSCEGVAALMMAASFDVAVSTDTVNEALDTVRVDFWVIRDGWFSDEYIQALNIMLVEKTGEYGIYCCN